MKRIRTLATAAALACTGAAQAALIDRGGGLIYDDVLNITWLQDTHYARTSGFDADGRMNWQQARAWAAGLDYVDSVRGVVWSDWRLTRVTPINGVSWNLAPSYDGSSDWTYNGTSPNNELSHLFHVSLGNLSSVLPDGTPRPGAEGVDFGMVNTGPFTNLVGDIYWTDTASPWYPADHALGFLGYSGGSLLNAVVGREFYAMAVRDGDVAGTVPEPQTLALALLALGCVGIASVAASARQRKRVSTGLRA